MRLPGSSPVEDAEAHALVGQCAEARSEVAGGLLLSRENFTWSAPAERSPGAAPAIRCQHCSRSLGSGMRRPRSPSAWSFPSRGRCWPTKSATVRVR